MKKLFLAASIIALSNTMLLAQNTNKTNNYHEPTAQERTDRVKMVDEAKAQAQKEMESLDKELKLNDKQKIAVAGITTKMLIAKKGGNMDAAQIADIKDKEFKYILTAEQYQKYKALSVNK